MISTQLEHQMKTMNVSIKKEVSSVFIATQTSNHISHTITSSPSTPLDNQFIVNDINPNKVPEFIGISKNS